MTPARSAHYIEHEAQIIRWEAPAGRYRARGRIDWTPVADALRERSGEWAVVYESEGSDADTRIGRGLAGGIQTATIRAFLPAGSFEAASRKVDGNKIVVYARFVGLVGETNQ